jgi:ABC-2 type transport system permease protein
VDAITLEVRQGEIFGLVGPNGAGKTTLVKMLSTLILPTSGVATVNGYDLSEEGAIKSSIGLVTTTESSFYSRLSCRENLRFFAGLHNLTPSQATSRIDEVGSLLSLDQFLDKRFDTCSTGIKHQVALARGLLNDPQLLFLDEPTRSLDPLAAAKFRETVYALAHQRGHTVFLVTHNLDEAVGLCDRIGVMISGRLRITGSPQDLGHLVDGQTSHLCIEGEGFTVAMADDLAGLEGVIEVEVREGAGVAGRVELSLQDRRRVLPQALRVVEACGGTVASLEFKTVSWDELFESLGDQADGAGLSTLERAGGAEWPLAKTMGGDGRGGLGLLGALYKPLLFLRRDMRTQARYRLSFLLQFLGIFLSSTSFYFVAQLLGAGASLHLGSYGGDYFPFVLIGIAFVGYQSAALYAYSKGVQTAQVTGTLEAMLVTPTRLSTILLSTSLWQFAFTSLRVAVYLAVGVAVFGIDLGRANVPAALTVLFLSILTLSGLGILSACFAIIFKRGDPINFLINSVSALLGGVYYPVDVLPAWLQLLARFFPLTYSLEALRRALLVGDSLADLARDVGVLGVFSATLLPISLLAFRFAVRKAKRDGSLTQF